MCGRYVLAADLSKMRRVGGWEFDYDNLRNPLKVDVIRDRGALALRPDWR